MHLHRVLQAVCITSLQFGLKRDPVLPALLLSSDVFSVNVSELLYNSEKCDGVRLCLCYDLQPPSLRVFAYMMRLWDTFGM